MPVKTVYISFHESPNGEIKKNEAQSKVLQRRVKCAYASRGIKIHSRRQA